MGGGNYSADVSRSARADRVSKGVPDFGYSRTMDATAASARKVHDDLDPRIVAGPDSPFAGQVMRESRDSDEHPDSLAIICIFDETGSMGGVPKLLVQKLPDLFGLIIRKGYVEHPQVMFGAVGDAFSDRVPIQVGQFESDNRCEEQLMKVYLEGNGGGGGHESYELMLWWLATHTFTDCWDKRGHKGYVFLIGDEGFYPRVDPLLVEKFTGQKLDEPMDSYAAIALLQERYHVFLIRPAGTSYRPGEGMADSIIEMWKRALGPQNVIDLPDDVDAKGHALPATNLVAETIAVTIGLMEGAIDSVNDGIEDLHDEGMAGGAGLSKALALVGAGTGGGGLATSEAPGGLDGPSGVENL